MSEAESEAVSKVKIQAANEEHEGAESEDSEWELDLSSEIAKVDSAVMEQMQADIMEAFPGLEKDNELLEALMCSKLEEHVLCSVP